MAPPFTSCRGQLKGNAIDTLILEFIFKNFLLSFIYLFFFPVAGGAFMIARVGVYCVSAKNGPSNMQLPLVISLAGVWRGRKVVPR